MSDVNTTLFPALLVFLGLVAACSSAVKEDSSRIDSEVKPELSNEEDSSSTMEVPIVEPTITTWMDSRLGYPIASPDFSGDGFDDLTLVGSGLFRVYATLRPNLGDLSGESAYFSFSTNQPDGLAGWPGSLTDLNGDGLADFGAKFLEERTSTGIGSHNIPAPPLGPYALIYLSPHASGSDSLEPVRIDFSSNNSRIPEPHQIGDLDGDGVNDAVLIEEFPVGQQKDHRAFVMDPLPEGQVTPGVFETFIEGPSSATFWTANCACDLNADGLDDLSLEVGLGRESALYIFFSPIGERHNLDDADLIVSIPRSSRPYCTGDLNGDGTDDYVANYIDGSTRGTVALMSPHGAVSEFGEPFVDEGDYFGEPHDFDSDGIYDFAIHIDDTIYVVLGPFDPSDGSFDIRRDAAFAIRSEFKILTAGDFDGDGLTDFVIKDWKEHRLDFIFGSQLPLSRRQKATRP